MYALRAPTKDRAPAPASMSSDRLQNCYRGGECLAQSRCCLYALVLQQRRRPSSSLSTESILSNYLNAASRQVVVLHDKLFMKVVRRSEIQLWFFREIHLSDTYAYGGSAAAVTSCAASY